MVLEKIFENTEQQNIADEVQTHVIDLQDKLFIKYNIPVSHGLDHALKVLGHMKNSLQNNSHSLKMSFQRKLSYFTWCTFT